MQKVGKSIQITFQIYIYLGLCSVPTTSHHPESEKNPKSETFLISKILEMGFSFCVEVKTK